MAVSSRTQLGQAYATLKTGTLWSSTGRCKGYAASNPGEAAKIDAYVAALVAGQSTTTPALATATGQGIVGLISAGFAPVVSAPPTITGVARVGGVLAASSGGV